MIYDKIRTALVAMMLLSFSLSVSAAKITYKSTDTNLRSRDNGVPALKYAIYFTGPIQQQDLQTFSNTISKLSQEIKSDEESPFDRALILNSVGGDVATALSIGRLIRANQMYVVVPDSAKCLSSCVFLLAAGVIKHPWGDIGIHRPYFETKPTQGYDQALKEVLKASRNYFSEMNIPEQLADDMFSIPPADIRLLGDVSLNRYRLDQADMAYAEDRAIKNAKAYGLNRQEYERRQKLSEIYSKECMSAQSEDAKLNSSSLAIECGDLGRQRAGLILK